MDRRAFLKNTTLAAGAFIIGFYVPTRSRAAVGADKPLQPNAFIELLSDNSVNVIMSQVEMGQGTHTTLLMCVAEELNVPWEALGTRASGVAPVYNHFYGPFMITGGSSSVIAKQLELRKVAAAVREMLITAAASAWKVPTKQVQAQGGMLINTATKAQLPYGHFVEALAAMEVPQDPAVKPLEACSIIGKPTRRHPTEAWEKVTGKAQFGIDVRLPGMKYAAVLHPPVFGATLTSYDATEALKRPGVLKVKTVPNGIALIAEHWWIAKEALSSIKATWDLGAFAKVSTADMLAEYGAMMDKPGLPARRDGDTAKAFKDAETVIEAEYDFPFLAHTPMEPHSVLVHHEGPKALIWCNAQMQTFALGEVVRVLGVKAENVTYKTPYLGGGFGRRGTTDYVIEGLHVAKDEAWPIMMIWSREDDVKGGWYRPMYKNRARLALDPKGDISALEVKIVGQQLMKGTYLEAAIQNGIEGPQTEGIINHPYAIGSHDIQVYSPDSPIHGQWWRSVGHTHSAPTIDGLIDEAAFALGEDPLLFRIRHLENLRHINALEAVAKRSGWDKRVREKNVGYGISVIESFGSVCAQVARVRVTDDDYRVEKVWCAIDCGFAFNPLNVENQMISAINFALGALKYSEITIASGACVQSNFDDFLVSRLSDAPEIEVEIINSGHEIGGIGEPGVPPLLAAVPNALFDATKKRYRAMPIRLNA